MPKITRTDKINVLNYVININVPDGKKAYYSNLSKAKIPAIDKLLEKHGVNDTNFNEYYDKMKGEYVVGREMWRHQREKLEEERKMNYELDKMNDEDLLSQFNSVPHAIKVLCEKKKAYEEYCSDLKGQFKHIKNAEKMFNDLKRSKLDTITWNDGTAELFIKGLKVNLTYSSGFSFRDIHRRKTTKDIIEDYKNGLIPVWFKIKVLKKKRSKKC